MTKGKKWTLRLLGVAALALLICLCLLGSTMARYTSTGNGSGTLTVALWDLETAEVIIDEGVSTSVSPDDTAYSSGQVRTNTSSWIPAFRLVNNSEVKAKVTVTAGSEVELTWPEEKWEWGTGWEYQDTDENYGRNQTNEYGAGIMDAFLSQETFAQLVNDENIFSIKLGTGDGTDTGTTELEEGEEFEIDVEEDVTFYAEVVWTSADGSTTYGSGDNDETIYGTYGFATVGDYADAIDSILGMYVTTLTFGVTWNAVQASTLPPTNG